jgi:hypothetical protein
VVGCAYIIKVDDEERPMLINSNNVFPYKEESKERANERKTESEDVNE